MFSTEGYAVDADHPAYLSLSVEPGLKLHDLAVWHFDGVSWAPFDAFDLTTDGAYASFTVTGFSGYAVSTVPEPSVFVLLAVAACGLPVVRRRRRV